MDYHDVVDELETAEQELGLAACDVDESEGGPDAAAWSSGSGPPAALGTARTTGAIRVTGAIR